MASQSEGSEAGGCWPRKLFTVLVVLLPKPDGGLRPIGLFPSLIRVWMRARRPLAEAWEAANASPRRFGGRGMGAQRAAWGAAFHAETVGNACNAMALLDLVKCFERIPHHHLVTAAVRRHYPLALLRLTLAAS